MIIYLYKYKNYYNRQVNKHDTPGQYEGAGAELIAGFPNITFNPSDGIQTELIVNYDGNRIPDYLLACSKATDIESRWYVIEAVRLREGQYKLSLLRDLVCDYYEAVISAPCFIEKATLSTATSLIYNKEDFGFSQIKKLEKPIDDASHTPWYALYINKDVAGTQLTFDSGRYTADEEVSDLDQYYYYNYRTTPYRASLDEAVFTSTIYGTNWKSPHSTYSDQEIYASIFTCCFDGSTAACEPIFEETIDSTFGDYTWPYGSGETNGEYGYGTYYITAPKNTRPQTGPVYFYAALHDLYPYTSHATTFQNLAKSYLGVGNNPDIYNKLNNKILKETSTGKFYRIVVNKQNDEKSRVSIAKGSDLYTKMESIVKKAYGDGTVQGTTPFSLQYVITNYTFSFVELIDGQTNITIPTSHEHVKNDVFDIIMFPAKDIKLVREGTVYRTDATINEGILAQLMAAIPKEKLYDVQLLPYVPIADSRFYDDGNGTTVLELSTTAFIENEDYSLATYADGVAFFMYYPSVASFTKSLTRPELQIAVPADPARFKLENESKLYRICSPNYNGAFEFSAAKNRGILGYNITCSYRPYNPYIKVAPIFNSRGMYGGDYGDARGLICGGDFSISQMSDQFASYELQNKNYQQMFNREIESLELQRDLGIAQDITTAIAGGLSTGGMGGIFGGTWGKGVGAATGIGAGVLSLAAGAADAYLNDKLRADAIDLKQDMFGYQLGNVQALPYNITKVSSRNADNKIFPFLEVYGATNAEEEAFLNKLKWNGMTVMAIGSIGEYLQSKPTYIKGKIIRFTQLTEEFHLANALANEINQGVYI